MESVEADAVIAWPLEAVAIRPIRPEKACGDDCAYDDDYLRMKQVIDGLSAAGGAEADFELLVELGEKVLASRSKDLRVAAFLAIGLERTRGAAGLAEAMAVIDALIATYWESLYPPLARMAGRQNALQALSDRLKDRVADAAFQAGDRPHLEQARERLASVQQFTLDAMADRAPALTGLLMGIDEALRKLPVAPTPHPETGDAGRTAEVPTSPSTPAPTVAAPDGSVAFRTPNDALRAVERAADFLRETDPQDAVPYLLLRAAWWGPLVQLPPNENARTLIPPPDEPRREALNRLAAEKNHAQLVRSAEELFIESPLLLDAQRHLVQGLNGLGEAMRPVRDAVLYSVAVLLRRVEGLPDLHFNDGTPFADGATRAWIETQVKPLMAQSGSGGAPSAEGTGSSIEAAYAAALAKLDGGDLQNALSALQRGADQDRGARDRFLRRLHLARLCITARQFVLARPILEGLDAELERLGLTEWEPALAIETWKLLHQCLNELARTPAAGNEDAIRQAAATIFDKICRVDAAQALALIPVSRPD